MDSWLVFARTDDSKNLYEKVIMEMDKLSDGDLALFIHMDSGLDKSHKDQDYAKTFSEVCNEIARRFPGVDVKSWASEQILKIEQKERMAIRRHSLPLLLADRKSVV